MSIKRNAALLAALMIVLGVGRAGLAEQSDSSDQQAINHIRLLEQMLRDAGVEPPARPGSLVDSSSPLMREPILPPSFATVVFDTEAAAINERGSKASVAVLHVRRWLERDDVKRRVAAEDIIKTLTSWSEVQLAKIKSAKNPVDGYIVAEDAIQVLGQDPLAKPFKDYLKQLQREQRGLSALKAMAAYRRAMIDAEAVGLTGDWELIDFQNSNVRLTIQEIRTKLGLIVNTWPRSEAGQAARHTLQEWADREAQAIADLPAWRYTWQMSLIQVGTETKTRVVTKADGSVYIREDTDIVYDPNNVILSGTFQNTSDKHYRYTFLAAVAPSGFLKVPFTELTKNQLSGYELVQTPVLAPGELFNWEVRVSVKSLRNLNRGGVTMVEVHER